LTALSYCIEACYVKKQCESGVEPPPLKRFQPLPEPVKTSLFQSHVKLIQKLTAKIAEIAKIKQSKNEQLFFVFFAFFVVE
jgi:hypothetical protein